jgi:hypothetical protein
MFDAIMGSVLLVRGRRRQSRTAGARRAETGETSEEETAIGALHVAL